MSFFPQVATVALGLFGAFGLLLGCRHVRSSPPIRSTSDARTGPAGRARGAGENTLGGAGPHADLLASRLRVGIALGAAASRVLSAIVVPRHRAGSVCAGGGGVTMVLTDRFLWPGPVRRALHIDRQSCSGNNRLRGDGRGEGQGERVKERIKRSEVICSTDDPLSVMYPASAGSRFDWDYYLGPHRELAQLALRTGWYEPR